MVRTTSQRKCYLRLFFLRARIKLEAILYRAKGNYKERKGNGEGHGVCGMAKVHNIEWHCIGAETQR